MDGGDFTPREEWKKEDKGEKKEGEDFIG